jgi:hypothetical protein
MPGFILEKLIVKMRKVYCTADSRLSVGELSALQINCGSFLSPSKVKSLVLSDSEIVRWTQEQSGETDDCPEDQDISLIPEKAISYSSALEWIKNLLDYLEQQEDMVLSENL